MRSGYLEDAPDNCASLVEAPCQHPDAAAGVTSQRAVSAPPRSPGRAAAAMDWPMSREEKKVQVMHLYHKDLQVAGGLLQSNEAALAALQAELDHLRRCRPEQEDGRSRTPKEADPYRQAVESAAAVLRAVLQSDARLAEAAEQAGTSHRPRARSEGHVPPVQAEPVRPALSRTPRASRCNTPKKRVSFGDRVDRVCCLSDSDADNEKEIVKECPLEKKEGRRRSIAEPEPEEKVAEGQPREPNSPRATVGQPEVASGAWPAWGGLWSSQPASTTAPAVASASAVRDECQRSSPPQTSPMVSPVRVSGLLDLCVPVGVTKIGMNIRPKVFPLPDEGVLVNSVTEGTWAHDQGLQGGDILIAFSGLKLAGMDQETFMQVLRQRPLRMIVERPPPQQR
eukprot:TRINITY_DN21822_c0_g1_i1.p1 TRINITY_DN21822_c0_g1~~TRINITY_DN21822_c0_g1_i1.p1  ORF type:complete len:396 (-),score=72.19 TRINITY_DN21822_c0_g1_i1:173-1360(-)